MKKLIAGNWKMNGLMADSKERAQKLAQAAINGVDLVLCPPATLIPLLAETLRGTTVMYGGQDCHAEKSGAFTGNISADMLKDQGCTHVIVGHSERRQQSHESSKDVADKAAAAHRAGLIAIICVGETDEERTAGRQNEIVQQQLKASIPAGSNAANTAIAYEPVWAIGTGKTASTADIEAMHAFIRQQVGDMRILYGGSVKGSNAAEILKIKNVDGVLVGGASLKAEEFIEIAKAGT